MTISNYSIDSGYQVPSVHVGTDSNISFRRVRTDVYFHRYDELNKQTGHTVTSPSFSCLGHDWTVRLYFSTADRIKIGLLQNPSSSCEEKIIAGISIHNVAFWRNKREIDVDRNKISTSSCVNGALWIEIRMRMEDSKYHHPCTFIPANSSACRTLQDLFMDKESADIVFKITGEHPKKFYAHRIILKKVAPELAKICMMDESPSSLVELPNISSSVFEDFLLYLYGCKKASFGEDVAHIKNIIEVADKFGVTNLKLDAEAWYVFKTTFTMENVIEHIEFAESRNCALLKEKAVDYIVGNALTACEQNLMVNAPLDAVNEVLAAVARKERKEEKFWNLSICELRRRAHEKELDVDGSRAMLISVLEANAKSD